MPSKKKRDPADLGILKLDPKAGSILEKVSTQLNKTPTEIISEFIYSIYDLSTWNDYNCHHDHDENDSAKNVINKSDVALNFESTIRHLHLLPGLTESIAELTGRDQDVEICNFNMDLEKQIVEFSLGLGEQDLEKMFVRMGGGHIQLFTNRIRDCNFADGYTSSELEKIKEYAVKRVRKSVPYADVIVNV